MSEDYLHEQVRLADERDRLPRLLRRLGFKHVALAIAHARHVERMTMGPLGIRRRG
jgi:hypothetical protein